PTFVQTFLMTYCSKTFRKLGELLTGVAFSYGTLEQAVKWHFPELWVGSK
uniref:Uncharacterized protein n=1 Tax=Amphimedon queenslandica TaxID=400682 RepID=A0A1X7UYY7_AMPQE